MDQSLNRIFYYYYNIRTNAVCETNIFSTTRGAIAFPRRNRFIIIHTLHDCWWSVQMFITLYIRIILFLPILLQITVYDTVQ